MLNIAADHINAVEVKEAAEKLARSAQTDRVTLIGVLQRTIADAERRKVAPIFSSEEAATTFQGLKGNVERLAGEYQNGMWQSRQCGRGTRLDLSSDQAIAFFFGDIITAKLPALADQVNSRDGRGNGINEEKRVAVIAECERTITEARVKLAELTTKG
jgi:hypothetical protein